MQTYQLIIILCICQLINVILGTLKTVTTARGKVIVAAIMNAIAYGFGALVTKQIATTESYIMIPIAIVTNLVGVYFCLKMVDKLKKDKIWEIKTLASETEMHEMVGYFNELGIKTLTTHDVKFGNYLVSILSQNRNQSNIIFKYLKQHKIKEIMKVE